MSEIRVLPICRRGSQPPPSLFLLHKQFLVLSSCLTQPIEVIKVRTTRRGAQSFSIHASHGPGRDPPSPVHLQLRLAHTKEDVRWSHKILLSTVFDLRYPPRRTSARSTLVDGQEAWSSGFVSPTPRLLCYVSWIQAGMVASAQGANSRTGRRNNDAGSC